MFVSMAVLLCFSLQAARTKRLAMCVCGSALSTHSGIRSFEQRVSSQKESAMRAFVSGIFLKCRCLVQNAQRAGVGNVDAPGDAVQQAERSAVHAVNIQP